MTSLRVIFSYSESLYVLASSACEATKQTHEMKQLNTDSIAGFFCSVIISVVVTGGDSHLLYSFSGAPR